MKKLKLGPKINLIVLGIILFVSVALGAGVIQEVTKGIEEFAVGKAKGDLNLATKYLDEKHPGEWKVEDNQLYKGSVKINGHFSMVDEIGEATGDTVTIFLNDTRVTTNVKKENGERAVGTTVSPEVAQVVLKEKKNFYGEANVAGHKYQAAYTPIMDASGEVIGIFYVGAPQGLMDQILASFMKGMIIVLIIAIFISFIVVYWFTKRLTKRLNAISNALKHSKDGDFTTDVTDKAGDELTNLSQSYNEMRENLSCMITQVKETVSQVAASSKELSEGAEQTKKATEEITHSIQQVADGADSQAVSVEESSSALEEVTLGINNLAENSSIISETAANTRRFADQGKDFVDKTVQQMKAIHVSVNDSNEVIRSLNESSREIGAITASITDIADQTNLLALNAAIEAARAGEHGKGFAVVADEVRKLAEQSQQSTIKISKLIQVIQSEILLTNEKMEQVQLDVKEGLGIVGKTEESFKEIMNANENMGDQISNMAATAEEMSASAQEVTATVQGIANIIRQTSSHTQSVSAATEEQLAQMEEILASASSLNELATGLEDIIRTFKVK